MEIGIGIGIGSVGGGFNIEKNLSLQYTSRSGLDLLETKSGLNLNGKILTPCFIGNNSGYYSLKSSVEINETSVIDIEFAINNPGDSTVVYLLGTATSTSSRIAFRGNTSGGMLIYADGNILVGSFSVDIFNGGGYRQAKISFNAGTITVVANGTTYTNTTTPPATWNVGIDYIGRVGASRLQSTMKLYYMKFSGVYNFYFNQVGVTSVKLYDALNSNHATAVSIVADNKTYDSSGTTYPYDTGYSLWQKAGAADIYAYYKTDGTPLLLTAGTDLPAGYTKTIDIAGSLTKMIPFDSIVGTNETASDNALLTNFDRSNETIQTASSRASAYYSATSLATKSRYHITEIIDPRVYYTYFNVGYNKMFAKISTSLISTTYYFNSFDELLLYSSDMKDGNEHNIMKYCGTDVFEVLDGNGNYTVDGNGYVIIV